MPEVPAVTETAMEEEEVVVQAVIDADPG